MAAHNTIRTDNVVTHELQHSVNVDLLDDVPEALDHILYTFFAHALRPQAQLLVFSSDSLTKNKNRRRQTTNLVAEALDARRPVRQYVGRLDRETRLVDAHAAATLARVLYDVAHARLQALRLAVRDAFAVAALAALLARGSVHHWRRLRAVRLAARAARLLLARRILRLAALHARRHVLAILAARRVLVTANGPLVAA